MVTFAAAVCIVYDAAAHQQSFFKGHDDDICCLALAPDRRIAASGQLGKEPVVLVSAFILVGILVSNDDFI